MVLNAPGRAGWRAAHGMLIMLCLGAIAVIGNPGTHAMPLRVYLAARAETFNLVQWEVLIWLTTPGNHG